MTEYCVLENKNDDDEFPVSLFGVEHCLYIHIQLSVDGLLIKI